MRHGFSRPYRISLALLVLGFITLNGTAAEAQWGYAAPLGYPAPGYATPAYGYGYAPALGYPAPVPAIQQLSYSAIAPQPYTAYSNPALMNPGVYNPSLYNAGVYAPAPYGVGGYGAGAYGSGAFVQDRVHYGPLGARIENYDVWGPGNSHLHVHTRDGWLGHHGRTRFHN